MNRYLYTCVLALALVTAYAVSQTGSYPSSSQPSNQSQSDQTKTPDASQSTSPSANNPSQKDHSSTGQSMPQSDQTTAAVDDQTLNAKIHEQLATNPTLSNVNVTVNNGVVTLEGSVPSKQDKKEAKKIAESVPGVKKVKDKLKVESSSTSAAPSGSASASSNGSSSSASTEPTTTASGNTAPSAAGSIAGNAQAGTASSGASSSTNPPSTSSSAGTASQDTGAASSSQTGTTGGTQSSGQAGAASGMPQGDVNAASTDNSTLQNQIQGALKNEPTLANDSISVTVTDSTVELTGTASSKKERQTARRIAQSYANNRKVTDHITVSGNSSSTTTPYATQQDTTNNPENKNSKEKNPSTQPQPDYPKR